LVVDEFGVNQVTISQPPHAASKSPPTVRGPDGIYTELLCFDHLFDLFVEVALLARSHPGDPDAYFYPIPLSRGSFSRNAN
jgi:hypothetical protein